MKIFYFGNPYVKEDRLAVGICEKLKKEMPEHEFIEIKNTFELFPLELENSVIIDVVAGLNEVKILDVSDLATTSIKTSHDFDLGFFLKLLNKNVKIIGTPQKGKIEDITNEIKNILKTQ
jgi:Ni,Fe-hydrogenase maturation factor